MDWEGGYKNIYLELVGVWWDIKSLLGVACEGEGRRWKLYVVTCISVERIHDIGEEGETYAVSGYINRGNNHRFMNELWIHEEAWEFAEVRRHSATAGGRRREGRRII